MAGKLGGKKAEPEADGKPADVYQYAAVGVRNRRTVAGVKKWREF